MLTSFDDYPIHQASVPVAHSATGDLNHYDRYFFNGYSRDASASATSASNGGLYFAAALGLYPNRHVADAAFSVVVGGRQHSVFHSQRAPHDRRDATTLGPIVVEVVQPLHALRVRVDAPDQGLRADLARFEADAPEMARLLDGLRRHGVDDKIIASVVAEATDDVRYITTATPPLA